MTDVLGAYARGVASVQLCQARVYHEHVAVHDDDTTPGLLPERELTHAG